MTTSILIIDDDNDLAELVSEIFTTHHYMMESTNHGQEGIELAKTSHLDLIILDIKMPDMDGFEVCRQIRTFSSVPILVLSATSNQSESVRILDSGADDFLQKPVNPTILLAHAKNLLRRANYSHDINSKDELLP